jgi:MFS family permease
MLAPLGLGFFLALPTMSRLSEKLGARAISGSGAILALLGTLPFVLAGPQTPVAVLALALMVRGFGIGSITIPSAAAAYASVPRETLSHAATAINICQRLGGPTGTTALVITLQLALARVDVPRAYQIAFGVLALFTLAALAAASQLPGRVTKRDAP